MLRFLRSRASRTLQALLDTEATIEFDLHGRILEANTNFLSLMGYRRGEVVGQHHRIFISREAAKSEEYRRFWVALARGEAQSSSFLRFKKDGTPVWLRATYHPVASRTGRIQRVIKVARDHTDDQLRQAAAESEHRALDRVQAIIAFDAEGRILEANPNFCRLMGYDSAEIVGQHHRLFVPREDQNEDYQAFWRTLGEGNFQSGEFLRKAKNGDEVWIMGNYSPILDLRGQVVRVVKFGLDITPQVRLRQRAEMLSLVANRSNVGMLITGADGLCEYANDGFVESMGFDAKAVIGRKPGAVLQGPGTDPATVERIRQSLARLESVEVEILNYTRHGEPRWIALQITPILDNEGRSERFVSVQADITATRMRADEDAIRLRAIRQSFAAADWDAAGKLLDASPMLLNVLGVADLDAARPSLQWVWQEALDPSDKAKLAAGESLSGRRLTFTLSGSEKMHLIATFNPTFDSEGALSKVAMYADDVSEQRRITAQVNEILDDINRITRRTHMVSFNATVEAARAGESGACFGIVAGEVRGLSTQSGEAAARIGRLLAQVR